MADEKIGSLYIQLEARTKKLERQLKATEKRSKKAGKVSGSGFSSAFAIGMAKALGILYAFKKAFDFAVQAKNAARDAQETGNKFDTVFSSMTRRANAMADSFAASFGLAGSTARELLGNTGDLLVGFGFTERKAADLANQVNALAVDLASFTNFSGGARGASAALTKALLGERESVKSLGISILEVDVKKQIAIDITNGLTFATERQAKAQATLTIAIRQSGKAIGDYARTKGDLANIERRVSEQLKTQTEIIGKGLLPAFVGLNKAMSGWMTLYIEFLGVAEKEQPLNVKMLDDYANSLKNIDWRRIAEEEKEAFEILEASNKKVDEFQKKIDFLEIGRQGILTGNQEAELKLLKERIKIEEFNNRILLERHRIVTDIQATGVAEFGDDAAGGVERTLGLIESIVKKIKTLEATKPLLFDETEIANVNAQIEVLLGKLERLDQLGLDVPAIITKDLKAKGMEGPERVLFPRGQIDKPEPELGGGIQPDLDPEKFQADLGVMESSYNNFWANLANTNTTFAEKLKNVWSILASSFSQMVGDIVKEWIVGLFAQQAASKASEVAAVASAQVTGRAVAAAWSSAAVMASIATFGGAAVAGTTALAAGVASAKGLAAAHDGGTFVNGKKIADFASSGFTVPGTGTSDNVPILTQPGEFVTVTPKSAVGNQDKLLSQVNSSIQEMNAVLRAKDFSTNINANVNAIKFEEEINAPSRNTLTRQGVDLDEL